MAKKASKRPARTRAKRGSSKGPARRSTAARSSSTRKARPRRAAKAARPRRTAAARAKSAKKTASRPNRAKRAVIKSKPAAKTATPVRAAKAAAAPAKPVHRLSLDRNRRHLPELEDNIPTPPSSLDMDRTPSAARSGRKEMREARLQHNETSPVLTGGDVDADWQDAYAVGDEAPGGDNPTPDQDRVDDIGKALGVQYDDHEELKGGDEIGERDRHRWELDPASAEDYPDHEE